MFIVGIQLGLRVNEYAQTHPTLNLAGDNLPIALCARDITFMARDQSVLPHTSSSAHYVEVTFRHQKNKNRGQKIRLIKIPGSRDPVKAFQRLIARSLSLSAPFGLLGYSAVGYLTKSRVTYYIKQSLLRSGTDPAQLPYYNTHSIRIAAAVLLFQHGMKSTFIKNRVRWKSDQYEEYFRDTEVIALQHSAAIVAQFDSPTNNIDLD